MRRFALRINQSDEPVSLVLPSLTGLLWVAVERAAGVYPLNLCRPPDVGEGGGEGRASPRRPSNSPVGTINRVEVSDALMDGWDIATRPGAHCAPLMHRALGTERQGIVRLSTSWFTTGDEIDAAIGAIREIAEG